MPKSALPFTVVTVNYRSYDYVSQMLASLDIEVQCVVVDNFSDDAEREKIATLGSNSVSVVNNVNNGFAGGVNVGAAQVGAGKWILLVNPDVTFTPGAIENLLREAECHELDLAVPQILNARTRNIWFSGGRIRKSDFTAVHERINCSPNEFSGIAKTEFISGCVVLISPKARKLLFPLDEDLFMYYEDVLMSEAANRLGLRSAVVLSSTVLHDEGGTSRGERAGHSSLFFYYQARNRLLTAHKLSKWVWLRAIITTPYFLARQGWRIFRDEERLSRKMRSVAIGVWDGLIGRKGKSPRVFS